MASHLSHGHTSTGLPPPRHPVAHAAPPGLASPPRLGPATAPSDPRPWGTPYEPTVALQGNVSPPLLQSRFMEHGRNEDRGNQHTRIMSPSGFPQGPEEVRAPQTTCSPEVAPEGAHKAQQGLGPGVPRRPRLRGAAPTYRRARLPVGGWDLPEPDLPSDVVSPSEGLLPVVGGGVFDFGIQGAAEAGLPHGARADAGTMGERERERP